jgi:hypothetical protein
MDFQQQKRVLNETAQLVIRYEAALNDLDLVSQNIKSYEPSPASNLDRWRNTLDTDIDAIYDAASRAVENPKEAELPQVHSESVIASIKSLKRKPTPIRSGPFVAKPKPQRIRAQALARMINQRRARAQSAGQISAPAR